MSQRFHTCEQEPKCGWCRNYDAPEPNPFRAYWDSKGAALHAQQVAKTTAEEARQAAVRTFLTQSGGCCH